nr:hypothetical protein Iba_scaffold4038CG0010 [Ipomoea batatas]
MIPEYAKQSVHCCLFGEIPLVRLLIPHSLGGYLSESECDLDIWDYFQPLLVFHSPVQTPKQIALLHNVFQASHKMHAALKPLRFPILSPPRGLVSVPSHRTAPNREPKYLRETTVFTAGRLSGDSKRKQGVKLSLTFHPEQTLGSGPLHNLNWNYRLCFNQTILSTVESFHQNFTGLEYLSLFDNGQYYRSVIANVSPLRPNFRTQSPVGPNPETNRNSRARRTFAGRFVRKSHRNPERSPSLRPAIRTQTPVGPIPETNRSCRDHRTSRKSETFKSPAKTSVYLTGLPNPLRSGSANNERHNKVKIPSSD